MKAALVLLGMMVGVVIAEATERLRNFGKERSDRDLQSESRIVGGTDADIGEYPFFVEWEGCGASLIHKDIILSAAHCSGITSNTVYVGSSRAFGVGEAGGRGVRRSISKRMIHPSYNDATTGYDFLVMQLDSNVEFQPTLLNSDENTPSDGDELTVIGYGTTSEGGMQATTLQEVNVNYIPTDVCNENYEGQINGATMLCAGTGGGKDSCQGDSGGPLFIRSGDDFTQVGVVSWGNGCADPAYPGIYSRISGEIDWIKGQICTLSNDPPDYCDEGGSGNGSGEISVRVDITYDDYPMENGWTIKLGEEIIVDRPVGSNSEVGLVQEQIKLNPGDYSFEIRDTFGDGICCRFQDGNYAIYAEMPDGDVLLASSDGQFGSGETKSFTVRSQGIMETPAPAPINKTTPPTTPPVEVIPTESPALAPTSEGTPPTAPNAEWMPTTQLPAPFSQSLPPSNPTDEIIPTAIAPSTFPIESPIALTQAPPPFGPNIETPVPVSVMIPIASPASSPISPTPPVAPSNNPTPPTGEATSAPAPYFFTPPEAFPVDVPMPSAETQPVTTPVAASEGPFLQIDTPVSLTSPISFGNRPEPYAPTSWESTKSPATLATTNPTQMGMPTVPTPYPTRPLPTSLAPITSSEAPDAKICKDGDDTFRVNFIIGNKDCVWLSNNMFFFGYLCADLVVATACQETCDACDFVAPGWV